MKVLNSAVTLLTAVLCIAAANAFGDYAPYEGWSGAQVGNAAPTGGPSGIQEVLDPADVLLSVDEEYPGQGEDEPGFGEWGPKDAGAAKPGLGFPGSGCRPPR
jgi:hypothetical protein